MIEKMYQHYCQWKICYITAWTFPYKGVMWALEKYVILRRWKTIFWFKYGAQQMFLMHYTRSKRFKHFIETLVPILSVHYKCYWKEQMVQSLRKHFVHLRKDERRFSWFVTRCHLHLVDSSWRSAHQNRDPIIEYKLIPFSFTAVQ